jgi:two-component system sensor histidine kinase CpxA
MRSLFLRIFFTFLVTILVVVAAVVVLTLVRDREFPPLTHQEFVRQAIKEYGRQTIQAYEREGVEKADAFAAELFRKHDIRLLLFDRHGRPLTRQRVPRRMEHMVQRAMRSGEVVFPMMGARNSLASVVRTPSGGTYIVALALPERPPAGQLARGVTHGFLGWQLLLLLVAAAIACFFLARSLTSPVSRLRQATRRFAGGDLSTRIGSSVKGNNEISGLAHDFDEMAGKIENLVKSQQQLLRDISHELRSPLARLGIALELARQEENPEVRGKALARIELESERMNEMIGQLLSLTRLGSGSVELQQEEFDLRELLGKLVQDADYEAKTRDCDVIFTAPQAVPYTGSRELLARALENVIRNAVRYTPDGSRVTVDMRHDQQRLLIRIADQGPGVPQEALGRLFEPFYRVADARDRQSGGTGIGLAIAERAVTLHSGSIRASNRPEGGLLVEISLPVAG